MKIKGRDLSNGQRVVGLNKISLGGSVMREKLKC